MPNDIIIIKERGWAGHFIAASACRYRRNTLVCRGAQAIVVSSVGSMVYDQHTADVLTSKGLGGQGVQQIGYNRYYERMIFRAKNDGRYIEADVRHECTPPEGLPWGLYASEPSGLPPDCDNVMDNQHDDIVQWVSENFDECYASGAQEEVEIGE